MNNTIPIIALLLTALTQPLYAQGAFVEASRRNPAVAAVQEMPRETPAEQLRAVFTLIDLGETEVAAQLWAEFDSKDLDDKVRAALVTEFGTARFLSLARQNVKQFAGSREFVQASLKAAAQVTRDPQRLAKLIEQLNGPAAAVRNSARIDLVATGTAGAAACLEALSQASEKSERTNLLLALAEMRPEVDPLLLAALADGRGQFRRDVCELAGHTKLLEAVPWLAAIATGVEDDAKVVIAAQSALSKMNLSQPSADDTRGLIRTEITRLESGVSASPYPIAVQDVWWSFDAAAGEFTSKEYPTSLLQLLASERLARHLPQLPNASAADHRTALIYAYQVAQQLNQEPNDEVKQWGQSLTTGELNEALAETLKTNSFAAAKVFVELLEQKAEREALKSIAGRPSPLVRALRSGDRQLRFLTLEAIMKIGPDSTFAGASEVPKALWYFASGAGTPQAVAASSVFGVAGEWAGQLRSLGFDASPAATGGETLRVALSSPRLQLLLIDSDISRPKLREIVFQLRSSPHTARTPVAVLCSLENLERAGDLAEEDDLLLAIPRPHSDTAMEEIVARLTKLANSELTAEQRTGQARQALEWIAELLEQNHPYDELHRNGNIAAQTIYVPELKDASLKVLTVLDTADSQLVLTDLASTTTQPIETRRQAVKAFATSVERAGKLLTSAQILRQFDRYNASENADADTQAVLGQVLDILEKQPNRNDE